MPSGFIARGLFFIYDYLCSKGGKRDVQSLYRIFRIFTRTLSIRVSADSAASAAPTRASHPGKRPGKRGTDTARPEQFQIGDGHNGPDRLVMRIGWSWPGDGDTLRYHRAQRRSAGRRGWHRAETCNRGSIHSTANGGNQ